MNITCLENLAMGGAVEERLWEDSIKLTDKIDLFYFCDKINTAAGRSQLL